MYRVVEGWDLVGDEGKSKRSTDIAHYDQKWDDIRISWSGYESIVWIPTMEWMTSRIYDLLTMAKVDTQSEEVTTNY